jgi:hypothetical protein
VFETLGPQILGGNVQFPVTTALSPQGRTDENDVAVPRLGDIMDTFIGGIEIIDRHMGYPGKVIPDGHNGNLKGLEPADVVPPLGNGQHDNPVYPAGCKIVKYLHLRVDILLRYRYIGKISQFPGAQIDDIAYLGKIAVFKVEDDYSYRHGFAPGKGRRNKVGPVIVLPGHRLNPFTCNVADAGSPI